jgi:ribosomal protein L11 methyltransferase
MSPASRRWLELAVRSPSAGDHEGLLAEGLVALGGRAVAEEDGGWFVSHFEEPADPEAFMAEVRGWFDVTLPGLTDVELRMRWIAHEDWAETWKRGLEPRRITDRLWVTTSWQPVEAGAGEHVIIVDPGMAFGTAEHGTTRGCLRLLDRAVRPGERILDVGAGSGILSIAAAALGASEVEALEADPLAAEALAENVERNGALGSVRWATRWADAPLLATMASCDGVVANIETGVLGPLLPGFADVLRPGGWLIVSGILAEEWQAFSSAVVASGFQLRAVDEDGAWRSAWFVREGR